LALPFACAAARLFYKKGKKEFFIKSTLNSEIAKTNQVFMSLKT